MPVSSRGITTTIIISREDYEWLKRNPQYNVSGLLRWAIKYYKDDEKRRKSITNF
jgi:hypothetical protein